MTYMVAGFAQKEQHEDGMISLENELTNVPPIPDYLETIINVNWSTP